MLRTIRPTHSRRPWIIPDDGCCNGRSCGAGGFVSRKRSRAEAVGRTRRDAQDDFRGFRELLARANTRTGSRRKMENDCQARLLNRAQTSGRDLVHYIPVWLFVGQQCEPFEIGPVKFVQRIDWLDHVETRRGEAPLWMATVKRLWAGETVRGGSVVAGLKGAWKSLCDGKRSPAKIHAAYTSAKRISEPYEIFSGRTIARLVHPDQWMACAWVNGFEAEESRRRGLLAAQVALDTIRLGLRRPSRGLISTVADSTPPRSIDRLNQCRIKISRMDGVSTCQG
ncbi:hypothetical protein GGE12_007162 [Rhizobium mongolense]|uniref:Uncharacterized protein n=1 Tax=Rhizobium mongolense TaxID=57676 RepID=A0A7W6RWP8_9HYPH|nr:hypothetical protein [Rhizobium mongolense]